MERAETIACHSISGFMSYGLYAAQAPQGAGDPAGPAGFMSIGGIDRAVSAIPSLTAGAWAHIAMTYDGTRQRLYINGVEVLNRAQTGSVAVSAGALRIGGNASWAGEFFRGLIDEVRVYNRALSAAEIAADMKTPIP